MKSETKVLLAGIDTLIINARYPDVPHLDPEQKRARQQQQDLCVAEVLEQVETWANAAKEHQEPQPTPWKHGDHTLLAFPNGTPTHRYLLKNGLIDLLLGPQLNNGALARVRFSSEYLWKRGVDLALMQTHAFLSDLFQEVLDLQPGEIHLCADVTGLPIPHNYERVFVTRAAKSRSVKEQKVLDKPIYRYHRLETIQFSGHGNPISMVIYDKPAEIEQNSKHKRWFYDLWRAHGWNGKLPEKTHEKDKYGLPIYETTRTVWRIECRIKREALHEMDIEEVYQCIELVPSLWAYCVGRPGAKDGWTRMVTPTPRDTNRARWETTPGWQVVQQAFTNWREGTDIEALQRTWKGKINLDQAEKAIAGYVTTYAAWLQKELAPDADVSVVLHRLYECMLDLWEKRGVDFQTLRKMKEYLYHIS